MSDLTLFFDTETTGFARGTALAQQPFLVQLAAVAVDDDFVVRGSMNLICLPDFRGERQKIPKGASDVHGITDEIADKYGVPYKVAIPIFNNLVRKSKRIVAYNMGYDDPVIRASYMRIAADQDVIRGVEKNCAMLSCMNAVGIPGKYGKPKWPNLQQAHTWATGEGFDGAHDAMVDVHAGLKVWRKILDEDLPVHVYHHD